MYLFGLFLCPLLQSSYLISAFTLAASSESPVPGMPMEEEAAISHQQEGCRSDEPRLEFPETCFAEDHYRGVTLHLDRLLDDDESGEELQSEILSNFEEIFTRQLSRWQIEEKRGIWVHLPIEASSLVPILAKVNFEFHMVLGTVLVMTRWLPINCESRLPRGPTHQVGVGCLIYKPNDAMKILVVKEKSGPAAAYDLWKMPTGLSDPDEDIHEAAMRELLEETGLRSSFGGLACLRQAPVPKQLPGLDRKFVSSRKAADLFFVCRLALKDRPMGGESDEDWQQLFKACPEEIKEICWMPISEFSNQELWQNSPLYQQLNEIVFNGGDDSFWRHSSLPIREDSKTENTLYHPAIGVRTESSL